MKANQRQALKELLAREGKITSSKKLDAKILEQAKAEIQNIESSHPVLDYLLSPLSQMGNALGAVSLTLICFLSMAKLTSIPEPETQLTNGQRHQEFTHHSRPRHTTFIATRPDLDATVVRTFTVKFTANELLMKLSLPSVPDLVDSMNFVAEKDRSEATIELIAALADINFLIDHRKFDDARDRYFDLLSKCFACELPTSLEALAIENISPLGSG